MKNWISYIAVCIGALGLCWSEADAQQRPIQSLYMFDPLVINPAYAGSQVQFSATAVYRNQWVNFPGAPKTLTASIHTGFRKLRVGAGLLFGNDEIGVHSETSAYGVYSYRIPLSETNGSSISFGIQGGFNDLKSDYGSLNPKDPDIFGTVRNFNPNFGAGIYFRSNTAYLGFSVPYMLNRRVVDAEIISSHAQEFRYYYLLGGFTRKISADIKILPSALIRIQEHAPVSADINLMTVIRDVVALGASWRLGDSVVGLFQVEINQNFHAGYAYDFTTSDLRLYSNGTHEIMVNYRFKIRRINGGLECPTYW